MRRLLFIPFLAAILLGAMATLPHPAAAGGGCHLAPGESTAAVGDSVTMAGCSFSPSELTVSPGTMVTFRNADRVPHALAGRDWVTGELATGAEFRQTFTNPGIYPYQCYLHPGMVGVVIVEEPADPEPALREPVYSQTEVAEPPADTAALTTPDGDARFLGMPAWAAALAGAAAGLVAGAGGLAAARARRAR